MLKRPYRMTKTTYAQSIRKQRHCISSANSKWVWCFSIEAYDCDQNWIHFDWAFKKRRRLLRKQLVVSKVPLCRRKRRQLRQLRSVQMQQQTQTMATTAAAQPPKRPHNEYVYAQPKWLARKKWKHANYLANCVWIRNTWKICSSILTWNELTLDRKIFQHWPQMRYDFWIRARNFGDNSDHAQLYQKRNKLPFE